MKSKSVAAGIEYAGPDVTKSEESRPQFANAPRHEEIQQRAYGIHIQRGSEHGRMWMTGSRRSDS